MDGDSPGRGSSGGRGSVAEIVRPIPPDLGPFSLRELEAVRIENDTWGLSRRSQPQSVADQVFGARKRRGGDQWNSIFALEGHFHSDIVQYGRNLVARQVDDAWLQ